MARASAMEQSVPEGWILTAQTRKNGQVDRCYYNPSTGYKFYSRKALFQHLASENLASPLPNEERSIVIYTGGDTHTSSNQRSSVDNKSKKNTRSSSDQLPDGWTKKYKPRKANAEHRVIRDPYYIDPASGYAFRSRMDAFRYIATGDINKCVIKPKKADASNLYTTENKGLIAKQPVAQVNRTPSCEAIKRKQIAKQSHAQVNRTTTPGAIKRKPTVHIGDSPEWLPSGWITEIRTRQTGQHAGHTYQCYFNPFTKTRFYSKKKVLRYLESEELHRPSTNKETSTETKSAGDILTSSNRRGSIKYKETCMETMTPGDILTPSNKSGSIDNKETSTEKNSAGDILTSSNQAGSIDNKCTNNTVYSSDELPDGWVKEIRLRYSKGGVHKDPYYIDPVGEYAFRSRKDVLRYLKTGDIRKCAMRPKMKHMININPGETSNQKIGRGCQTNKPLPVHKKGCGHQKRGDQPVDSQMKRRAAQLRPRKTKSFKAIALPIRSSKRLAGKKSNHVVDSQMSEQPDEPEDMPIIDLDFFEKREAEEPPKVEETKLSGEGLVENQEGSAIIPPDQSLIRADNVVDSGTVTRKPKQNLSTAVEGSVGIFDLDFSEKLVETMDTKPEQLAVQCAAQNCGKSDEREVSPTLIEKIKGTITEQLPVTPVQSDRKSYVREAFPAVDEGILASKSEKLPVTPVQGAVQSGTKSEEQEAAPTVKEGMMAKKPKKSCAKIRRSGTKSEAAALTLNEGTMASKHEKLPVPVQGAAQSCAKSVEREAAPSVNLDFFEIFEKPEEYPGVGERKPIGDTHDSPLILPFGDSWSSDPCLEFAFKTLTGDIPVLEDTALVADYFQQQISQSSSPVEEPHVSGGTLEKGSQSGRKRKASGGSLENGSQAGRKRKASDGVLGK